MIPSYLLQNRSVISTLQDYLVEELRRAHSERKGLEDDWQRFAKVYRARPESPERDFPFRGAANLTIPVAATDVDTTVAGLMGALWSPGNLWTSVAQRPDWIQFAARLTEFLGWAQDSELGMYEVSRDFITELVKLGTAVLKTRYKREWKRMYEFRESPQGNLAQTVRRMSANHPEVSRVALADFYLPSTARDIETAPWCAERVMLSYAQIEARVRAGLFLPDSLAKLGYHWRQSQPRSEFSAYQTVQEELDKFTPGYGDSFELFEFWTNYQIDPAEEPQALVCTIHIPSNTYLRIDFNPFFNQEPPYNSARFIAQEGRFYGIGLCEALEMFQEEISTQHCQRIDNATIHNTALFKARRGSGIKTNEPIWPGRTFLVDAMDDLQPMQMGYPLPSTIGDEQFTLQYARQRSGISDYQRGGTGTPAISYSTATTTVEMLRQGRLRLDQTLREIQRAVSGVGQKTVELYQQFDQAGKTFMVMGDQDGAVVQQVLQFPLDFLRAGVKISVTATSATLNKEAQVRTNQIVLQSTMQFYEQLMQVVQVAINPQVPPEMRFVATSMIRGGSILMRRILDTYDIQDLDSIVPDMERFFNAQTPGVGLNPQSLGGGAPMAPGLAPAPGISGLLGSGAGTGPAGPQGAYGLLQGGGAFPGPR